MAIRKQDKTIIHGVALLGAVIAALASGIFFQKLPEKQHSYRTQQTELMQQAGALDKLKEANALSEQINLVETVSEDLIQPKLSKEDKVGGVLGAMSPLQLGVLTVAGAIGAGAASYGLLWAVMYLGSLGFYAMIRSIYGMIEDKDSDACDGQGYIITDGKTANHRNPHRVFPIIFKLAILVGLALLLLSIVVWQLTSMEL
ncbi:MAG: hypothetical protein ABFD91_00425 [Anaerohalosphaeraceae bacterium]